jgi:CO/xanthine dehydrogenase FAD-binding subunit
MLSAPFDYLRVESYEAAAQALAEHGDDAKLISGGQSLVPMMNLRLVQPAILVDLNAADQRRPEVHGAALHLPALTRHRTLLESSVVRTNAPLLARAAQEIGNTRVRSRGTVGGSLAHADPTAELCLCAMVLEATVLALSPRGVRRIAADELFETYLTTTLEPDEVISEVIIPTARDHQGWGFQEMVRRASDFAVVAVAALVDVDAASGSINSVRLGLAGVADRITPVRADALQSLVGTQAEVGAVNDVAHAVASEIEPESDVHASGRYRKRVAEVLTRRALREAFDRATTKRSSHD